MDSRALANQAETLTSRERALLGLLALWSIDPLLEMDSSVAGRRAVQRAQLLWEQAWDSVLDGDISRAARTEELVASSDELQQEDEPGDSSLYRLDFLVALLYAIRSNWQDSKLNLARCLQQIDESLDLLDTVSPSSAASIDITGPITMAIKDLEQESDKDREYLRRIRNRFIPTRETCRRAARPIGSS